jgi:hypothetical protein
MQRRSTPLEDWEWEALRLSAQRLGPKWRILAGMLAAERLVGRSSLLHNQGIAIPPAAAIHVPYSTRTVFENPQIEYRLYTLFAV